MAPSPETDEAGNEGKFWRAKLALCLCHIGHLYTVCNIFSYAGIMSVDLGWAVDRDHAGFVAGFLQSANTLGRIPTAGLWGLCADRCGYRRAVFGSFISIVLGGVFFGLSVSLAASVVARAFLMGIGNGWMTLMGPLCAKVGGAERQMEVVSAVYGAGQFVQLVAPALGGWTYNKVIDGYPAAAPSLIGTGLGLIAIVAAAFWLPKSEDATNTQDSCRSDVVSVDGRSVGSESFSWLTRPVPMIIALRGLQGCVLFTMFDIVPLWAISTKAVGGLALSETDLGELLAVSGIGNIVFSVFAMSRITRRLGLRRSFMWSCIVSAGTFVAMPMSPNWIVILVLHIVCSAALTITGAVALIFTNNAVAVSHRGQVNGISTTFEALFKGIGPATGATVLAWSLSTFGRPGRMVIFCALATLQMSCFFGSASLPAKLENAEDSPLVSETADDNT